MAGMYCLTDLLNLVRRESAQELRLQPGKPPVILVNDETRTLDLPELTPDNIADLFSSFATPEQTEELRRCGDIHFTCASSQCGRFVVTASSGSRDFTLSIRPL